MMGRRSFGLGLGATLLSARALAAARAGAEEEPAFAERKRPPIKETPYIPFEEVPNHRALMRGMIGQLGDYCRKHVPALALLVRGGPELIVLGRREWEWRKWTDPKAAKAGKIAPIGSIDHDYLRSLDGLVIDGMYSGFDGYGQPTLHADTVLLKTAAKAARGDGKAVFLIEYGPDKCKSGSIARAAAANKFVPWTDREGDKDLGILPRENPERENAEHIRTLSEARNFLLMLRSNGYPGRAEWVTALAASNYDLLVLDPFWNGKEPLSQADVGRLKMKKLGSRRLVMARMPLGCASEGAYYWSDAWRAGDPSWLVAPIPDHKPLWLVEYWNDGWKTILGQYIESVAQLGFDGVMLDQAGAYVYFEDMMPID